MCRLIIKPSQLAETLLVGWLVVDRPHRRNAFVAEEENSAQLSGGKGFVCPDENSLATEHFVFSVHLENSDNDDDDDDNTQLAGKE